jgi:hypothetical protein
MGKHENEEVHPEYSPTPTSVVKASGDKLAINDNLKEK